MATPTVVAPSPDWQKSRPYFTQRVRLQSLHAQQIFDRGFEICANAIFSLSVILRIVSDEDKTRELEGVVDERLNKTLADLRNEAARLVKIAEANGIELAGIEYSHPRESDAKITSPRVVQYLLIIREFDGLTAMFDTLWLSGVIPDGDYSRAVYEWKRRLLRLAGGFRALTRRATIAARKRKAPGAFDADTDDDATTPTDTTEKSRPRRPAKQESADTPQPL